ncbi:hypothetical protein AB0K60_07105 [Thermopolyspora sp. NPDC052614]|uniref:hypothetical protein n=1 Tax=Thermopolyspora sp. NPDC052614 TaxID=3155682 RepID=UPI003439D3D8
MTNQTADQLFDRLAEVPLQAAGRFRALVDELGAQYPLCAEGVARLEEIHDAQARLAADCARAVRVLRTGGA